MNEDYPAAISEAVEHLERYKRTGEEGFLWRAYRSARLAQSLFPTHAAAFAAEHPGWSALSSKGVDETMKAVLVEFDSLAASRGTGKNGDTHAAALLLRERIVGEIRREALFLAWRQDDIDSSKPERRALFQPLKLKKSSICQRVADRVGVSRSYVQKVWEEELKCPESNAILSLLELVSQASKPASVRTKKAHRVTPKRPGKSHVWRKPFKT